MRKLIAFLSIGILALFFTSDLMAGPVLVTKKMIEEQLRMSDSIPIWLVVVVGALVLVFTFLLILSPVGSSKRRGRRRTIFK